MKRDLGSLPTDLDVKHHQVSDNVWVLTPKGVIDSTTSDMFKERLRHFFEQGQGQRHFLLDMSDVRYISSVGLGTLIGFLKHSKEKDWTFALYDTQLPVRRVLEISRLDFLLVDPESMEPRNPFADYIRSQEKVRRKPTV